MTLIGRSAYLALACVFALTVTPAIAQEPAAGSEFSEAKLDAFADAAIDVNQVMVDWRAKIQAAQSQEDQEALIQQANQAITDAIADAEGISFAEYEAIAQTAEQDSAFAEKLQQHVAKKLEERQ